jgi:Prealbumin-like fold domain
MEVGMMLAHRKKNHRRRLTGAGLIAVTAATLLMMVWAIFPTAAFASPQSTKWDGKQGVNNLPCTGGSTLWIFAGFGNQADDVDNVVLHVDNQTATMVQNGNEFRATVSGPGTTTPNAFATWDWNGVGDPPSPHLTISHCEGATTTPPPEKGRIEIEKQTLPNGDPATFGFTGEITATLGDGQSDGKDVEAGTYTVSETALAGWTLTSIVCNDSNSSGTGTTATFNVAAGETVRCVFTNTKNATTTTPPGGGGGGGTTTTPPPAPTTTTTTPPAVAPTTTHHSTTTTVEVLPTTVTPGGTAFTGVENVVPIGAIALMLMTSGSGLLWVGSRRRRHDGSEDED